MFRFASITTFFLEKYTGKHYTQLWSNFNLVFPKHTACKPNQNCNRLVLNLKNSFSLKKWLKIDSQWGGLFTTFNKLLPYYLLFQNWKSRHRYFFPHFRLLLTRMKLVMIILGVPCQSSFHHLHLHPWSNQKYNDWNTYPFLPLIGN